MAAQEWALVERLFLAATELPEEEANAYIERMCAGRPELLAEVHSLLQAHRRGASFLERALLEPGPRHTGAYRLLEPLGRGGMGAVHRAARIDGQFEHQVAVKLLSVHGGDALHKRFADERQILANLSHPNIARLLDGGVTDSGTPYIVMELVEGAPLDRYCPALPLPARLALFRQICAAVHYAHQHLVVHRDLKPANILVTAEGVPKLLDFGIAKILAHGTPSGATIQPAMTPDYASPEQARGETVSTASDIYSLGVVLHELVTGRRPHDLAGKTHGEIMRTLSDDAPANPRSGSVDLDAIILKALRQQPGERYPSAEAMSADIGRYLDRRPVEARRGAAWYVASRFVARHRIAVSVALAAAVVLAIAVGVVVRQSRIAQRRFDDVRRLASSEILQIHDAVARLPGSLAARKLIVTNALGALDRLSRDSQGDTQLQLELAEGYQRLGDVQGFQGQANLGEPEAALASYAKARAQFRDVLAREPGNDRAERVMLRTSRTESAVLAYLRRTDAARAVAQEAVALAEARYRRAANDESEQDLAAAYSTLADTTPGEEMYRRKALEMFEKLLAARPGDSSRQRNAALAHKYLANPYIPRAHGDNALPHLKRAEELDFARVQANPRDREARLDLSFDYSQNGTYFLNREDYAQALAQYRQAQSIRQQLATEDPLDARLQDRIIFLQRQLGIVLASMKRNSEALAAYREALRLSEVLVAKNAAHPQYQSNLTLAQLGIADTALGMGGGAVACNAWRAAEASFQKLDGMGKALPAERRAIAERAPKFRAACP